VTISGNNSKLVKDWIRPLQKSLTIETENKFINTLGREKYFNDYLYESLQKLDNLNISEEYLSIFYEFSKKYNGYNKLDEKSIEIKDDYKFGWSSYSEITNGRFAMIGFLAIIIIDLFSKQSFLKWAGIL